MTHSSATRGDTGGERRAGKRPFVLWLLGALALVGVAYLVPVLFVDDGLEDLEARPLEYRAGNYALQQARSTCLAAQLPVINPRLRVVRVERVPGSCRDAAPDPEVADYVAYVRTYSLFAIPTGTMRVTCGGNAIVCPGY
jgi:hypothetical protein